MRTGYAASRRVAVKVAPPDDPENGLPITGGRVDFEPGQADVRARCSLDFETPELIPDDPADLLAPFGQELQIWRDDGLGEISLGIFRNIEVTANVDGGRVAISLSGLDRASRVMDEPFDADASVPAGTDYLTAMIQTVQEAYPTVAYSFPTLSYQTPLVLKGQGESRWQWVKDMAAAIGHEIYFNREGVLTLIPVPLPQDDGALEVSEGEEGILLSVDKRWSRDDAVNRYIVTGENAESTPVRGVASDDNVNSPTYYGGPFGKMTRFESFEFITTTAQAEAAAEGLLNQNLGISQNVSWGALVNPELDPGDSVLIRREQLGLDEVHVVETLTVPLSATEPMTGTTRKTRVL